MDKCTAIVLAAGQGKRMGGNIPKQFLHIEGHPIVAYSLKCFERMSEIQEIILVTGEDNITYCEKEIVEKYQLKKVKHVIAGGKERYDSVYEGLKCCEDGAYVYIHDGARPFVDDRILRECLMEVKKHHAVVTAVPSKDTIKISDKDGFVVSTPDRSTLWNIQTPQVFSLEMIRKAHEEIRKGDMAGVTDDSMIVESLGFAKVKLVMGSYDNIKITTPEDLVVAENILNRREELRIQ